MSAASVAKAVARALLAVLFSVAIWVWGYALSESVSGGLALFIALPIVVLATLLYMTFRRWRRHVGGGSEPPPLRWKVAGAVLALVLVSASWAGLYAYVMDPVRLYDMPMFAPFLILGVPPVLGMVILIYRALGAASRR